MAMGKFDADMYQRIGNQARYDNLLDDEKYMPT